MVSLAQVLGFIVGPALQAIVTPLGVKGVSIIPGVVVLNMYTAAGWINVFMAIVNFCLFLPIFFKVFLKIFIFIRDGLPFFPFM